MYRKGASQERKLAKKLTEKGFVVVRAAGSGNNTPDLIAGKDGRVMALECKYSSKDAVYIEKSQIDDQILFAEKFGAEMFVAVKFSRVPWVFLSPSQLEQTEKSYKVSKSQAKGGRKLRQLLYKELSNFCEE